MEIISLETELVVKEYQNDIERTRTDSQKTKGETKDGGEKSVWIRTTTGYHKWQQSWIEG